MDLNSVIFAAITAYLGFGFYRYWQARKSSVGASAEGADSIVAAEVMRKPRALLYFHSEGCMFCRSMTPVFKELDQGRDDVFCIDAGQETEFSNRLGVRGTPTIMVLEFGVVARTVVGSQSEKQIHALLEP